MTKEELTKLDNELREYIGYHAFYPGNPEAIKAKEYILSMIKEFFQEKNDSVS